MKQLDADNNALEGGIVSESANLDTLQIVDTEIKGNLIGKKVNDTVIFNPKKAFGDATKIAGFLRIDYEDATNLDCNFECTIVSVQRRTPAELDKTLFELVFPGCDIETVEQFREKVESDLEKNYQNTARNILVPKLKDYILGKCKMALPEEFLKKWYLKQNEKLTAEQLDTEWKEVCNDVKWTTILQEMASAHNIQVDDNEVFDAAKEEVRMYMQYYYNITNFPEESIISLTEKNLEKEGEYDRVSNRTLNQKVVNKILEMIDVEEVYLPYNEFVNIK
jgi:trigger factor